MKRLLIISLITLGIGLFVNNNAQAQVDFGVKGGVSLAKQNVSSGSAGASISSESTAGFLAGVYAGFQMSPAVTLQPELLFVQKGGETSSSIGGNTYTNETTLNYIEIPVLAKYGISTGSSFTPYAAAGPYLGFNVKAEEETSTPSGSTTNDVSDSIKGTDFGLGFEAGADVSGFNIAVRYDLGLTDIDDTSSGAELKNRAWFITAGYSF